MKAKRIKRDDLRYLRETHVSRRLRDALRNIEKPKKRRAA